MKTVSKIMICAAAALLSSVFIVYSQTALLLCVALAAYMGSVWGTAYIVPVLAAMTAGSMALGGCGIEQTTTLICFILCVAYLTFCARRKLAHRYALLGLAILICVGNYLSIALPSILAGEAPYEGFLRSWEAAYKGELASMLSADMVSTMDSIALLIPDLLMPVCVLTGEAYALAIVLLLRACHRLFKTEPQRMAPFSQWQLPQSILLGSIIICVGIAAVILLDIKQSTAIALSAAIPIVSCFFIQGMAYLMFIFGNSRSSRPVRIFVWAFVILSLPYSVIIPAILGIKEQLTKKRPKIARYLEQLSQEKKIIDRIDEYSKYGYIRDREDGKYGKNGKDEKDEKDAKSDHPDENKDGDGGSTEE